jgi:hypothetical protein
MASILGLIIAISMKIAPESMMLFSPASSSSNLPPLKASIAGENESSTAIAKPIFNVQPVPLGGMNTGPLVTEEGPQLKNMVRIQVNLSKYENRSFGIQVLYPSDWLVQGGRDNSDGFIEITEFISPFRDGIDTYRDRVRLYLDSLPHKNMTIEEYSNKVIGKYTESLQGFKLLDHDTDSTVLAGYPGYKLVYTRTLHDGNVIKQMEIGTKINDKVYYLVYYAEEEKFPNLLPVIQDMINSLKIVR